MVHDALLFFCVGKLHKRFYVCRSELMGKLCQLIIDFLYVAALGSQTVRLPNQCVESLKFVTGKVIFTLGSQIPEPLFDRHLCQIRFYLICILKFP